MSKSTGKYHVVVGFQGCNGDNFEPDSNRGGQYVLFGRYPGKPQGGHAGYHMLLLDNFPKILSTECFEALRKQVLLVKLETAIGSATLSTDSLPPFEMDVVYIRSTPESTEALNRVCKQIATDAGMEHKDISEFRFHDCTYIIKGKGKEYAATYRWLHYASSSTVQLLDDTGRGFMTIAMLPKPEVPAVAEFPMVVKPDAYETPKEKSATESKPLERTDSTSDTIY